MNLTILGTGNATVTHCYNTCFVLEEKGQHLLVDGGGGNGLLQQLEKAHLRWQDMRTVFVTHKHIDHLLGIIWLMRMMCQSWRRGTYDGEAVIYGHDEVIGLLRSMATNRASLGKKTTSKAASGSFTKPSASTPMKPFSTLTKRIILPSKTPASSRSAWTSKTSSSTIRKTAT